jgi:hypothetical protein
MPGEINLHSSDLPVALGHLPKLIGSLGAKSFGHELIGLLSDLCHADHCTIFKITEQSPCEVVAVSRDGTDTAYRQSKAYLTGSYWRYDTPMSKAMASVGSLETTIQCSETRLIANRELRDRITPIFVTAFSCVADHVIISLA